MHIVDEPRKFSPSNVLTYTVVQLPDHAISNSLHFSHIDSNISEMAFDGLKIMYSVYMCQSCNNMAANVYGVSQVLDVGG